MASPADSKRLVCPGCGRYLGTVEATYAEYAPCQCGVQTTVRLVGRRGRQCVEMAGERIEVKSR